MPPKYKKRSDGRYCTHVIIGLKDDGSPLRKTIYAKTIRELEEKAAEVRRQVSTGSITTGGVTTVAEWAREWKDTYKSGTAYNTQSMYRIVIEDHIIPSIGMMKIKDVRPHHIQRIINEKSAAGKTRTVEQIALTLKQIFKKAIENNFIAKNPAESIELPKKEKTKKRALTDQEISVIQTSDLDLKETVFSYILLYAGLRKGEALALMKSDIDLEECNIRIDKTLIFKSNSSEIKPSPKSKAGNRTIPIPYILIDPLSKYIKLTDTIYLFTGKSGNIMTSTAFRRFWEKIIRKMNKAMGGTEKIKMLSQDITPHLFRHTYATMLFYAGVDIKAAQYLLGHANANITMDIYTHLDTSKNKSAIDKLNSLISSSQKVVKDKIKINKTR